MTHNSVTIDSPYECDNFPTTEICTLNLNVGSLTEDVDCKCGFDGRAYCSLVGTTAWKTAIAAYKSATIVSSDCNVGVYYDLTTITTNKWMMQEWYNCIDDTGSLDTLMSALNSVYYPTAISDSTVKQCFEIIDLFANNYWFGDTTGSVIGLSVMGSILTSLILIF